MRLPRRRFVELAGAFATLPVLHKAARAQQYPTRPIKFILSETAGSSNDVIARILAPVMSSYLGQSVIVDNRPGGAALVGLRVVLDSPPDGYTVLVSSSSVLITSALLNKNFSYDLTKDISYIAGIASTSWVLVINPAVPVKTLQDLIAYAKANPGKLNVGFAQGTGPQMVAESFKRIAGIDIVGIPYAGGSQVVTDLLGGRLHMYFGSAATTLSMIESGALKALVVTGASRDPLLPDLPTMSEAGFPDLTLSSVLGIFGPAHLPSVVIDTLYRSVEQSTGSPKIRDDMRKVGYALNVQSPQEFGRLVDHYRQIWLPLAKDVEQPPK